MAIEDRRDEIAGIISKNFEFVTERQRKLGERGNLADARSAPGAASLPREGSRAHTAAILDEMRATETAWCGAPDEIAFLNRIFDLTSLPSHESRFQNAEQDIWQHCTNNFDWPIDWVYSDPRFRLYTSDQDIFLTFICDVLHPMVRKDDAEQNALARSFNGHLRADRWELVEDAFIDGRSAYVPQHKVHALASSVQRIKAVAATLNSDTLYGDLRCLERLATASPARRSPWPRRLW